MLSKLIKFVKANVVAVVGITAIVVSLLLCLLPGQFVDLKTPYNPSYNKMNGYQFFFNTVIRDGETVHPFINHEAIALPAGIAIFVLALLAIAALVFNKKSSILPLLAGMMLVAIAVLFIAMEASVQNIYNIKWTNGYQGKEQIISTVKWVAYLNGAITLLAGAYVIYKGVLAMKDEIKHPQQETKSNYYSYLKK